MRLAISGIGPDKERKVVTWNNGSIEADDFLKALYESLGKTLKAGNLFHAPNAIAPSQENALSWSAFFYISRFILKDVKIVEGTVERSNFIPEGAEA